MTTRNSDDFLPAVHRARIDRLNIYEVSEQELTLLERGSSESLLLIFAIFLLSTAVSFLVALLSTDIPSLKVFSVFVIISVVSSVLGGLLIAFWWWNRRSRSALFDEIRGRMVPEGVVTDAATIIDIHPSDPEQISRQP